MKKINKKPVTAKINSEEIVSNSRPNELIKKENLVSLIPAVLLILVLVAAAYGYYRYGSVATVNGKPISRIEYIQTLEKQGGKQILDQKIQELLILSEATKKGVTVDQNTINGEIEKIDTQIKSQGQTLEEALKTEGMTRMDLEKQIRIQKLVEQLAPKTEITQQQIDEFLTQNKDQLPKGASKDELQTLAKTQLESQNKSSSVTTWLDSLKKEAKIIYK